MAGEDFLKFNSGQIFSFSNLKEIKEKDLKNADAETKRLFNIFAGDDHVLQADEARILWNKLKASAASNSKGDNSVFDKEEMQSFLDTDSDIKAGSANSKFSLNALTNIVSQIFVAKEPIANKPSQKATPEQVTKACQETVIGIIEDNVSEAEEIFQSQSLGAISGYYDNDKNDDNKLKTSNVQKVLDYQHAGEMCLTEAKEGKLTRRAYYEENKQRLKDMILTRLTMLKTATGVNLLDFYSGKYSKEQFTKIVNDYIDKLCSNAEMDKLKDLQKQFISFSGAEELDRLEDFVNNAIDVSKTPDKIESGELKAMSLDKTKGVVPSYWDSAEPISFEEVYKLERGTEYSQYKVEQYVLAKKEMETVVNAYNKKKQFVDTATAITKDNNLSVDEKIQQIMSLYSEFYAMQGDDGLGELQKIIDSSNTLIKLGENGLDLSAYKSNEQMKNSALNKLLYSAIAKKEKDFESFLGGKTIEEYQDVYEKSAKDILGEDNAKMLSEAMKNDNMTVIQRYTGNASMAGMGMTVVGGVLCFTPLAPLGAGLVTLGNTFAIGGMVAKNGLGAVDYATKEVQTKEELEDLAKDFVMDAGGFIVGMGAGKAGMKAFSKLIDKKLTAVFAKEITAGNRMQALKTVLTNPEYLKNFMTAAGAKISTDFLISYAGDLAMMGMLDSNDDWQSLLQANLTGILVGMSGDVKDIAGIGKGARVKPSSGTTTGKPMTQENYAMSLLGKEVTVKDSATGVEVTGTANSFRNVNGEIKIEVNGREYAPDGVVGVKDKSEAIVNSPSSEPVNKVLSPSENKLKTANLDDEAIRTEMLKELEEEFPSTRRVPGRVQTLKELQALISSPEYLNMSETQKQIAKLIILKSNPRIDSWALFEDAKLPIDTKRQLICIESCLKPDADPNCAAALYRDGDFELMMTIAKAKGNIDDSVLKQMEAAYNKAQANGCLIVHQTHVDTDKFESRVISKDNKTYNIRVLDCSDPKVFETPEKYGLDAGTTPESLRFTVHMNNGINQDPRQTVAQMRARDSLNLSASITDGRNALYGDYRVGLLLDYDMGSVGYASNYAAGTGFGKGISSFAEAKLNLDEPQVGTFIRERFIEHLNNQGTNITIEDYAAFSKQFQGTIMSVQKLRSIAQDGFVDINGKKVPLDYVEKSLLNSTDDLMNISYEMRGKTIDNGLNEIDIYNPEIKAIYVRANSADETLESILSPQLLDYIQKKNIPVVFNIKQ